MTAAAITAVLADIGGTNTRVAQSRDGQLDAATVRRYRNADYAGLGAVLHHYVEETGIAPQAACVAVAGPVRDGAGKLTNIDWHIDRETVQEATGAGTVAVLNDLQAQGHALGRIAPDCLTELLPGTPASEQAARLVIGVGTGMNAAPVFRLDGRTLVPPGESGHITLPVQTEEELSLMRHIAARHGTPGVEDVLSGRGFERVYAWLCADRRQGTPKPAAEIMASMEAGDDPLAREAVAIFTRILGRVCGNLALITLPFGGIYLIGGVARHFGPYLLDCGFAEAFADKGRFSEFMGQFPVSLVTDDYAALTGCASHLTEQLEMRH
ncbi:glucokinase [Salipiger mucosus]|uniref:Glucokinase n=1 Tax=Salipiger mucosus DSM 16094 TaxID=1123237 RepID=S9Q464_9RHOB|nr:glucokinase [Salipiger mucosus]EPX76091.1 Glucokinase [Salipiger mucosus DSM 16094]